MVHLFQHIIDQLTLNVLLNTTPVTSIFKYYTCASVLINTLK